MFKDYQTRNNRVKKARSKTVVGKIKNKLLLYLKAPSSFKMTMF